MPGRLSVKFVFEIKFIYKVTRTIGDIEAKLAKFGGNDKVIIPIPDIS